GYYWPVTYDASREKLHSDAELCQSSCQSEARLFYFDNRKGDITEMTDLTGRAYSQLRTAYKYRKKLVPGCSCKPPPWSASERARHARYAEEQNDSRSGGQAGQGPAPNAQQSHLGDPQVLGSNVLERDNSADRFARTGDSRTVDQPDRMNFDDPPLPKKAAYHPTSRMADEPYERDQRIETRQRNHFENITNQPAGAQSGYANHGSRKYRWPGD
ncbi:MAG: DUF2865 domain-containing protein, partial [Hyphomicrobiaceae bacterium]